MLTGPICRTLLYAIGNCGQLSERHVRKCRWVWLINPKYAVHGCAKTPPFKLSPPNGEVLKTLWSCPRSDAKRAKESVFNGGGLVAQSNSNLGNARLRLAPAGDDGALFGERRERDFERFKVFGIHALASARSADE